MVNIGFESPDDRVRLGWWVFVLILAVVAVFIAYEFVGLLALGVFGYYASRPIYRRLNAAIDSDGIAAWLTLTLVLLPVVVLLISAGFQVFQQIQQLLGGNISSFFGNYLGALSDAQRETLLSVVQNPRQVVTNPRQSLRTVLQTGLTVVSGIVGALLLLALAITLSYFLLKNDDALASGLCQLFGGRDTTAYAYASVVDDDLESVFFGNFLFVVTMSVVAAVAYWGTNVFAPEGLHVPMVLTLAFLTGIASLIPIIVGKVVYLPVIGYLGFQAIRIDGNHLAFVGGVLVAYFLVLDILPQTFLQPYITGRQLDMVMMMFAYLLGPVLFGWYGFFLLPIVFVLMLEAIRIVLPELIHGRALTPTVSIGESVGTTPRSARNDHPGDDDVPGGENSEEGGE